MDQLRVYRKKDSFLPILVLTADITAEARQRALSGGANDFLTKPFDLIDVGLRIRNLLQTRYLYKQVENQNQILEEKVKERTSELEKTNSELIVARNQAEAGDRLKTAFIRNISHEIRTPMNGIMGISSLLADQELSNAEKIEYIPFLRSSINRMIGTFTDYLDISLIVSDNVVTLFKPFDINKELREVEHKYRQVCQDKKITLNLHLPDNDGKFKLNTDKELFIKIVNHLVDNAVKFTSAGSVTFGYSLNGNSLGFFVEDTGIGIGNEARQRIFETFTQENTHISRDYEGSGLGLSIVRGFLKRIGGDLSLESEKGQGTAFYFTLPLH